MAKIGIVAFAFGMPWSLASNEWISKIASDKAIEFMAPVFTQRDVRIIANQIQVSYAEEALNKPPPTLRIARGAAAWAKAKGIETLMIVAAKPHVNRCQRDLACAVKELGVATTVVMTGAGEEVPEMNWFCMDSEQERTRTREAWERRERILMALPMFLYKLVAS